MKKIAIVGNPNVGKSVLFNALSNQYAAVSNYPGTSVEVSRGELRVDDETYEVVDTPGMYALSPITEEERVARRILLHERPDIVLHVVDAKNLERMLPMTLQLIEAGLPLILVLNMMDEAVREGLQFDAALLAVELGVPVVGTTGTTGAGLPDLRTQIRLYAPGPCALAGGPVRYPARVEQGLDDIERAIADLLGGRALAVRALAALLLREDADVRQMLDEAARGAGEASADAPARVRALVAAFKAEQWEPVEYQVAAALMNRAQAIVARSVTAGEARPGFRERLSRLVMHPLTGFPILLLVLYFGLFKFVGGFGAGTVVDWIEGHVFDARVTPWLMEWSQRLIPWPWLRDLFTGDYGVLTLGVRYALALILPIVTCFFLAFAIIEDSGYLPRLAMLVDRAFKKLGLSGRAVIPMVLGLGCDTMATLVTRTLPTRRERLIATLLLALAVPCSAQLGVILALLQGHPRGIAVWAGAIVLVFLLVGFLTARLLPGSRASFYMEIPPLRWPQPANVLVKTYVRVKWYLWEILPLFLVASVLIWIGQLTGLFDVLVRLLVKPVQAMGLPPETAPVFLFGFFRRDYGAAGLYDLSKHGVLTGVQLTVASVALTLFLPCVAQFLVNIRERGWKVALAISAFVLVFAFAAGCALNAVLVALGARL